MIRKFPVTFDTSFEQFWKESCKTLESKGCHELKDAIRFLSIWKDHFRETHGELKALSHLSNPDDPPDVIAHFSTGDATIEITGIDPSHVRQSDDLHNKIGKGCGHTEIPLSIKPANRQEALEMLYNPGQSPWETVLARNQVWFDSIIQAVEKKTAYKGITPGILLLPGKIYGTLGELRAVEHAFAKVRERIPAASEWILATFHQWNHRQYFSAIDIPGIGFKNKIES